MRRDSILIIIGIVAIALGFLGLSVGPSRLADNSNPSFSTGGGPVYDSLPEGTLNDARAVNPDGSHIVPMTRSSGRLNSAPPRPSFR